MKVQAPLRPLPPARRSSALPRLGPLGRAARSRRPPRVWCTCMAILCLGSCSAAPGVRGARRVLGLFTIRKPDSHPSNGREDLSALTFETGKRYQRGRTRDVRSGSRAKYLTTQTLALFLEHTAKHEHYCKHHQRENDSKV